MAKGITWPDYKGEPRHYPGIPGVYGPGVVVPLESTGLTEGEAKAAIKDSPLELVDLKEKKGGD